MGYKRMTMLETLQYHNELVEIKVRYFKLKFPHAHWSIWIDKVETKLVMETGIGRVYWGELIRAFIHKQEQSDDRP